MISNKSDYNIYLMMILENLKLYDNYFGIQLNKNTVSTKRNKSVKRPSGASEYMNWKNLLSPTKELDLLRSISSLSKVNFNYNFN